MDEREEFENFFATNAAVVKKKKLDNIEIRSLTNCFELSEETFIKLFRIKKDMADELICIIEPFMDDDSQNSDLNVDEKVLGTLRFLASGSYQQNVEQHLNITVDPISVGKSINEVVNAVHTSSFFSSNVKFHRNVEELNTSRQQFFSKYDIHNIIGCIDCTHIAMVSPEDEENNLKHNNYLNSKGFHSINVQLICDADMRLINCFAKYPGSTHDSLIWNNSNVFPIMEKLHNSYPENYFLLGDSRYALRPWMLTPIANAKEGLQSKYNDCHKRTHSLIETVNGILKMRFRCLLNNDPLPFMPETVSKIINTCCALHNMCIENKVEPVPPEDGDDIRDGLFSDNKAQLNYPNHLLTAARLIQQNYIMKYLYDS